MAESDEGRGFETLASYQHALRLYEAACRAASRLPPEERFNLADQIRRASLSALLNIAEGYGRYHYLDKLRFFYQARGSLCETLSAFIAAQRAGYIDSDQLAWIRSAEAEVEKALNGYIAFIRKAQSGAAEYGHRWVHEDEPIYQADVPVDPEPAAGLGQ